MFIPTASGPIEVWLSQPTDLRITCRVVTADERTEDVDVDSLSMRGAQREITGWLVKHGYRPDGRWEYSAAAGTAECARRFRGSEHAERASFDSFAAAHDD